MKNEKNYLDETIDKIIEQREFQRFLGITTFDEKLFPNDNFLKNLKIINIQFDAKNLLELNFKDYAVILVYGGLLFAFCFLFFEK